MTTTASNADVRTLRMLVAGAERAPHATETEPVYDPATGAVIAHVPLGNAADVDAAVAAARAAFPAWQATPVVERTRILFHYHTLLEAHFDELARLVVRENGKTLEDARGEVRRGIEMVEYACGAPTLLMGETVRDVSRGIDCESIRYPLGVIAGITPFNFPMMVPHWMIPLALVCGNTFVLKPSERTPLSAERFAHLLTEAGLPAGVFNVVHGARATVTALLEHPDVRAVSFVGSQPVAAHVYRTAAAHGKRVQALAGAKNHLIVLPDAKLDQAVPAIIASAFGAAGERCLAGSVVVAVGGVADELVRRLDTAAGGLRLGSGLDSATGMGPVIRADHRERVRGYIARGKAQGASVVRDGTANGDGNEHAGAAPDPDGFFLAPTIFDRVTPEMDIAREEIFGPVLSVVRVETLEEGIAVANRSRFGNAASIFTTSGADARTFRERIEAGMLGVNVGVAAPLAFFPFAGWKNSFYGDLHATGKDAIAFYTDQKVITSRW
ncbi:MAG TPA: CoA-acylating methylmalonate-semialdehyde dehydrogenase [Ktedonobacterales bacterium]|nr:CoA-acylating methylmalonate-semialdehyde dehydrogenase [Ktedonobacterales bacterium]